MSDDDQNVGPAPDRVDDPRGNLRADHGDAYTLQEVIGDIIDNSIDASSPDETVTVEVFFEECDYTDEEKEWKYLAGKNVPYVIIADDAKGMDLDTLNRAMGRGWTRDYNPWELGHYGVGLKKSALSNAYELTIFSKIEGGEINVRRYSSCYIEKYGHDGIMDESHIEEEFPWMMEAASWSRAKEILDGRDHGTIVLLEGLPKLFPGASFDAEDIYVVLDRVITETSHSLSLTFGKYISKDGANIEYKCPVDDKLKKINKKAKIFVDEQELESLDPFYQDFIDGTNFGTLTKHHKISTFIEEEKYDVNISIHIVPNSEHPNYEGDVKKRLKELKMTRLSASPESLQGCYVYRNQRLVDYGKEERWKGAYTSNLNPKQTAHRWEVHLPVHRSLGTWGQSEWKINTSKSEAIPDTKMKSRMKKLAEMDSKQVWHEDDPDYTFTAAGRANKRRSSTDNGTLTNNWDRWAPICKHCTDKNEAWKHKSADHICSIPGCGKKGHQGAASPKCKLHVARPIIPNPPVPDPKENETPETDSKPDEGAADEIPVITNVDNSIPDPISISTDGEGIQIKINSDHPQFNNLMRDLEPIVQNWRDRQSDEEE